MDPFEIKSLKNRTFNEHKDLGFDESFLDAQKDESEAIEAERVNLNYRIIGGILILSFLLLAGRIFFLQIVKGEEFRDLAEGNKLRTQYVLAPRGLITDRYGEIIVNNVPSFELVVLASDLPDSPTLREEGLTILSAVLKQDIELLRDLMGNIDEKAFQPQTLLENVPKDQALVLISQQDQIPGFEIQKNPIRDYKDAESFSHLIGYTGKITGQELTDRKGQGYLLYDFIGKTGIEVEYEEYLKGLSGKKQVEIDVQGNYKKDLGEVAAIPGNNVSLKVDAGLQKVLYDSLLKHATISRSRKAAAVAQNPKTGEVLALVSLPGFDTNQFAQGISSEDYSRIINDPDIPLLNRVIGGTYPPGSTIKPALGIAALTEGVVTPQTRILDDGVIRIGVFTYYGYDRSGLGLMNIYSAIARSSDIYFYTVGGGNPKNDIQGMGPDKLAEWYRKFNLGSLTAIDLPSEKDGLVPDPEWKLKTRNERWFLGNTYHYSIGQGDLLVTPLQLNTLIGSIANGGRIMQPYILNQVTDFSGEIIDKSEPKIVKENFLDPEYLKIVQDAMRQTVTSGSGIRLNSLPIAVAGKTGTAQFSSRDPNLTHAWFTSYAPFEDPEIVLTILVEGGGEGSSTAAPVAKEVYQWWADNRLDIEE